MTIEICATSIKSIINAQNAGANRIELCEDYLIGGVTPSLDFTLESVKKSKIPINVLIRPRGGDFNFNDDFSGEADRLYPVAETELTEDPPDSTSSSKYARLLHSNVSYSYPSILLCPQAGDPTIGTEDDATVWIKMKLN